MLQAIVLGIVQGVTEFLPISSSGHLILIPHIFKWQDPGLAFDAVLHLATGLAILFFFGKEIFVIGSRDTKRKINFRILWLALLASLPAAIVGLFFKSEIEDNLRYVEVVAGSLIMGAVFLFWAEKIVERKKNKVDEVVLVGERRSLIVGFWQVLSLVPGFSRSGAAITGGLFSGLDRKTAVSFSFLAGLPVIFGAGLWELKGIIGGGFINGSSWLPLLAGFFSAFVAGVFCLKLLLWLAERANFIFFVIYRIFLGVVLLIFFA
ncbi:undecaprenyl-diphosphate phosphatase [Candidatus Kuenenbacteria bacterium]|nr:undecaprenyl-diphosphate phosphatase [Candidatus Kuenenbacteria bacterium]